MLNFLRVRPLRVNGVYYPELKYESSSPTDFMGFERLDRLETTPKLTRTFRSRPSHSNETSYGYFSQRTLTDIDEKRARTVVVDTLAFTTPWTSSASSETETDPRTEGGSSSVGSGG